MSGTRSTSLAWAILLAAALAGILVAAVALWRFLTRTHLPPLPPPRPPANLRILRDLLVGHARHADGAARPLRMNLFLPAAPPAGNLPVILWVRGGAWLNGDREAGWRFPAVRLAQRGYAVASADYRSSDEARFPAQLHDLKGAIRWLRANAAAHGLDGQRIGAWGESAGGHLAALLGVSGDVSELEGDIGGNLHHSSRVQAVCDFYGPTDLLSMAGQLSPAGRRRRTSPDAFDSPESRLIGGPLQAHAALAAAANPCRYVSPDGPPFLIFHGLADLIVPWQQSDALAKALEAAGVWVMFHRKPDGTHAQDHYTTPECLKLIDDFFDAHLKPGPR